MSFGFLKWFSRSENLAAKNGEPIEIWKFNHVDDPTLLSEWATHFRSMYVDDALIDDYRSGTGLSRSEYLLKMTFPDKSNGWGPLTRSGDFAELLVADFLEFLQNYWIPRVRYDDKATRNSSTQGSDVVGLKMKEKGKINKDDELIVIEVKAQFSGNEANARLQAAVNDSNKDVTRVGEFLNYAKRRYVKDGKEIEKKTIERFQNISDNPYVERFGAAALFNENVFDESVIKNTDCSAHSHKNNLKLIVISGKDMMTLVHSLYERAANEA